ncbi:hypothetical protein EYF80_044110 [Liparis tanakae]|uniref:Uncharacterized protein n=1 Tax=Liparis tanakae TaxID=230148 RepID=A0A4Z2FXH1_9TELE|nr:hypothetical protein EYF80_044110 [Liparis tanakae]
MAVSESTDTNTVAHCSRGTRWQRGLPKAQPWLSKAYDAVSGTQLKHISKSPAAKLLMKKKFHPKQCRENLSVHTVMYSNVCQHSSPALFLRGRRLQPLTHTQPESPTFRINRNPPKGIGVKMLIAMLTAMYMVVRVVESIGVRFAGQQDPSPYLVSQPLPWHVHSVSRRRRSSKIDEFDDFRRNSIGVYRKKTNASNGAAPPLSPVGVEKAAATIQTHYRKFQQKKQKNGK